MAQIRFLLLLVLLLFGALAAVPGAQTLSSQVLQLLSRINTWTAAQTFQDLRLGLGSPSDTSYRLYNISGSLYWNGALVVAGGGGGAVHNILSATHGDTVVASVTRGGLITGQGGVPSWTLLTVGAAGTMLRSDGTDVSWGTDASALTALNASALASGTVPLARITGLTNAQVDAAAGIVWTKIDKAGSSLADLTTRSAADLTSGTLADARLSANVSLFGTSVATGEILDGTILFADWAANGCASGQYPQYNGSAWICSTVTPGSGTVTSVGLTLPGIFSVSGSPVTTTGTLAATLASQTANLVWAGPSSGGAAAPTFRSLVYDDFPTSAAAAGTYPKVTINTKGIVTGTASQITLTTDVTGVLPLANGGTGLSAAADDSILLSNGSAWSAAALSNCTSGLTYATATNTFGCSSGGAAHALLSATHTDTLAASVVRGDLIVGSAVPQWNRLALGASGYFLRSNGSDVVWADGSSLSLPQGSLYVNQVDTFNAGASNTNAGTIVTDPGILDYGLRVNANVLINGLGRGGDSDAALFVIGGTVDTVGNGRSSHGLVVQNEMVRNSAGTHPLYTAGRFRFGGIGGTATVTTAATLYVENAPTFATNNYGLLVDAGVSRFDDGMVERGRTQLVGEWTTPTFSAAIFTAGGAMTWTVDSGDVNGFAYSEIGKTQKLNFTLATTTLGGVANPELRVTVPNSRTIATTTSGSCLGLNNAGARWDGFYQATAGNTYVSIYRSPDAGTNWTLETNLLQIRCDMTLIFQ